MGNSKAPFLDLVLEVDHKQGSALGDDIVFVPVVPEGILEVGRGQAIDRVDGDFQCLGQSVCRTLIRQILGQCAVQHLPGLLKVLVFDLHTGVLDLLEPLGVLGAEQLLRDDAGGVHGGNVQQGDVAVHTRLGIDVAALANLLTAIEGLPALEFVSGEDGASLFVKGGELVELRFSHGKGQVPVRVIDLRRVAHIPVIELVLGALVSAKYNSGGEGVGGVIHRHPGHVRQDFPGHKVGFPGIKDGLGSNDIVVAVFRDLLPHLLRNRLVPGKTQLLVMKTQLDLPFLQALLDRAEVIHVRIRDVVGLPKEAVGASGLLLAVDDLLGQVVELLVGVTHQPGVQNMIVVPAAVEPHQTELHQLLDLRGLGVDHPDHGLTGAFDLPVHQEQIGEYLYIIKDQLGLVVFHPLPVLGGFEGHLIHQLDAVFRLVGAVGGEGQDRVAHIGDVVGHTALIGVRQNLVDKVDRGLSSRMDFLIEVSLDLNSKPFFALNDFGIYHIVFSFQR